MSMAINPSPDIAALGISPFLNKTYNLVDDPSTDHIVSWSAGGRSFTVWQPVVLERDLLSQHFKHSNIASFIRQLNNYGFRKVNPDRYEFASPGFIKGKRELLATLQRADAHRRQKKTQEEGTSYLSGEDLHDTVETLKADKTYLNEEVDHLRRENVQSKEKLRQLEERLERTEQLQSWMANFLQQQLPNITGSNGTDGFLPSRKRRQLLLVAPESDDNAHYQQITAGLPLPFENTQQQRLANDSQGSAHGVSSTPREVTQARSSASQFREDGNGQAGSNTGAFNEEPWRPQMRSKTDNAHAHGPLSLELEVEEPLLQETMSLGFLNSLDVDKLVQEMQFDNGPESNDIMSVRNLT
eukprot:CAMPEP_0198206808 /NCGR_PEP_ID=MMETSP1445-20131203/10343_1 /TAXON_ID=36898 /ORGANISM="Pyramimonas sp., Strain CCMP2087" /LENGTH=355 /DNA_ID=CAMNT_0043879651 /DNA_START=474 /DNA_END=1541 /DNA_ORIENTATION=-